MRRPRPVDGNDLVARGRDHVTEVVVNGRTPLYVVERHARAVSHVKGEEHIVVRDADGTSLTNANTDGELCGDGDEVASINGDTIINVLDLQNVAAQNGTYAPTYVADFDVNKDGAINSLDLQLIAARMNAGLCS